MPITLKTLASTIEVHTLSDNQATPNSVIIETDDDLKITGVDSVVAKVGNQITYTLTPKYEYKQIARVTLPNTSVGTSTNLLLDYYDGVYNQKSHFVSLNGILDTALSSYVLPNPTTSCYAAPAGYKWVAEISANLNVGIAYDPTNPQPYAICTYCYIQTGTGATKDFGVTEQRKEHPIMLKGMDAEYQFIGSDLTLNQNATTPFKFYFEVFADSGINITTLSNWVSSIGGINITNLIIRVNYKLIKV